jgi:SAM-dependent methyltransferase
MPGPPHRSVADVGGALGPLGFDSVVTDIHDQDIWGNRTTSDLPSNLDVIFSSHTLEHMSDPQMYVALCYGSLKPGGWLILNLPSDAASRVWSPENYKKRHPDEEHPHLWLFTLWWRRHLPDYMIPLLRRDDEGNDMALFPAGFEIHKATYAGDDCLFVIARKA